MDPDRPERHGFSLRYMDGFAVLIVPPEARRARPVYADDIVARMKILGIPPVSARIIRGIVDRGSGRPEPLVEWPAGAQLNASVTVSVSDDGLRAEVRATPPRPGGAPISRRMIEKALKDAGVIRGIDSDIPDELVRTSDQRAPMTVARGKAPKTGRSAHSECLFITRRGKPWKELNGGRIDLKELNFIQNRRAGDLLVRHIPPVPAEDGYNVLGAVIEADPVEEEGLCTAGEGVAEIEGGLEAAIDGNVRLVDRVVNVEPSVIVENVDYSTGNIVFDGSVAVEGTVADGFTVKASGDIQVGKTVGRGRLEAGRNLILRAGMVGDSEGFCSCGGNLFSRFLEGSHADVAGDLIVSEAILHSEVEVDGNIYLTEGRGEITGGTAVVGGSISCKKIGNVYAGNTRIVAGCPPDTLNAFQKLGSELKNLQEELDEVERQLGYLRSRAGTDPREITNLERGAALRAGRLKAGGAELKRLRQALEAGNGTIIAAEDRIFPGSSINFGLDEYPLGEKGLERVLLKRENRKTVMHGLKNGEHVELPSSGTAQQDSSDNNT